MNQSIGTANDGMIEVSQSGSRRINKVHDDVADEALRFGFEASFRDG